MTQDVNKRIELIKQNTYAKKKKNTIPKSISTKKQNLKKFNAENEIIWNTSQTPDTQQPTFAPPHIGTRYMSVPHWYLIVTNKDTSWERANEDVSTPGQ